MRTVMAKQSSHWRFVLVGLFLVAAIIVATTLIIDAQRKSAIEAYRIAVNNLGVGMAHQTARSLGIIDASLRGLRDLVAAAPAVSPEQVTTAMRGPAAAATLVANCNRLVGIHALALIDQQGKVAASCGESPPSGLRFGEQQLFELMAVSEDTNASVGRPSEMGTDGEWTAALARRINSADGGFAGIVLAELSLRELEEFYKVAMPRNRSVSVARRDGVILVRYPLTADAIGTLVPNSAQWSASVANGGGTYISESAPGSESVIASVNPLPELPFVVEATVLEHFALADWNKQWAWFVAGGTGAIATVLLLLWLFAWQYRRIQFQYARIQASEAVLTDKNFELDAARGRLHAALSNISQGVCFFDGSQRLQVANDRFAEIYGLSSEVVQPGVSLSKISEARTAAGTASAVAPDIYLASINAREGIAEVRDFTVELQNGRIISVRHQPTPDGGWVATHEDITERREADAKIAFLATHDVLTGLANRALLQERIERAQLGAKQGEPFAILFLDLDDFKAVNSSVGHHGGDELLHAVAKRLIACVREGDTVARTGGDEFVVLLQNPATADDAGRLASRIVQRLDEPFQIDGREINIGTSIGIAVAPGDGTSVEALTRVADIALYAAKAEGRGRFRFFESQMDAGEKRSA
ncbi:MAG TPA: diguanylate cyclase [Bauldia sp.]|nr:diguanylate cyclase [Bauldia sp.]